MKKTLKTTGNHITTIEIGLDGTITYVSGNRKTTFNINDCNSIVYEYEDGNTVITPEMLDETAGIEPWLWLVISEGESRLEYNKDQAESRRHQSYSAENDKYDTLASEENHLKEMINNEELEELQKAIRKLEPQQQELIMDIYYRGITLTEISIRDGVNKSSVTKRITRILEQLRKNIKRFD
jgi:RNA polymerase sigma factor (sigma-70 family)